MCMNEERDKTEMKGFRLERTFRTFPALARPRTDQPPRQARKERKGKPKQEKTRGNAKQTRSRTTAKKCKMKQVKRQRV